MQWMRSIVHTVRCVPMDRHMMCVAVATERNAEPDAVKYYKCALFYFDCHISFSRLQAPKLTSQARAERRGCYERPCIRFQYHVTASL